MKQNRLLRKLAVVALLLSSFSDTKAQTSTFSYTGSVQTYTVPAGVDKLGIDMSGASGGLPYTDGGPGLPATGGRVQCELKVTSGQTLFIYVGGAGPDWTSSISTIGGFNGGGPGGSFAASGGGATDIRTNSSDLTTRLVVAGGGGGGGDFLEVGGAGGGLIGGTGMLGACGGGQTGPSCETGYTLGLFGMGATAGSYSVGGGGGGWWGGNSGVMNNGAGGGGSSYTDPVLAANVTHTQGYSSALGNGVAILSILHYERFFANGTSQSVGFCSDAINTNLDSVLAVNDKSTGATDTIEVVNNPMNGVLAGFPATISSGDSFLIPTGLSYTPNTGFIGTDSFVVLIHNGLDSSTSTVYFTVKPLPTVDAVTDQMLCNGFATTSVLFSGSIPGTTYNWTNTNTLTGVAVSGIDSIPSLIATNHGSTNDSSEITVTPNLNGCTNTATTFKYLVYPTPIVSAGSNSQICIGATTTLTASEGTTLVAPLTVGETYTWTPADGLASTTGATVAATPTITTTYTVTLSSVYGCASTATETVTVNPYPVATITDPTVCIGSLMTVTSSVAYDSTSWSFGGTHIKTTTEGGTTDTLNANMGGTYMATVSAKGCTSSSNTYFINTVGGITGTPVVCTGLTTTLADTTMGGSWMSSDTTLAKIDTMTGVLLGIAAGNPIVTFTSPAGCYVTTTATINPTPNANIPADQIICNNTMTTKVVFAGSVANTTFTWANVDTTIGLALAGMDSINVFTAMDTTNHPDTATITIVPTTSTCTGATQSFKYIVNPTPVAMAASQTVCNTASTSIVYFSSSVMGSTYSWTNSDTTIGLALTGTDSIAVFTATDTTNHIDTATLTVTASANSCASLPASFTIIVFPTPNVDSIVSQTRCNGANTDTVKFTGAVAATTFTWTNNLTSIGTLDTGTGNINSFAATNTSFVIDTATIIVTPHANGCQGSTRSFMYVVDPTPNVTIPSNVTICNGVATTKIIIGGAVANTNFAWTNTDTSIGLGMSGIDSLNSFTARDTSNVKIDTSIVSIMPTANSCTGLPVQFSIVVNPTPNVFAISSQTKCNGALVDTINFGGIVPGTTYSWVNDSPSVGLAATGNGYIAAFTATNTSNYPDSAIITVTPTANSCAGPTKIFVILVNPTPLVIVNGPAMQNVCNGASTTADSLSSNVLGTSFTWTNDLLSIGLPNFGTTAYIPSFVGANTDVNTVVANVLVTATANGCLSAIDTFRIGVYPTPVLSSNLTDTLCSETVLNYIPNSLTPGVTYTWYRPITAHITNTSANGTDLIMETLVNDSLTQITATYIYTLTANGCSNTQNVAVVVNPAPHAPAIDIHPASPVCLNTMYQNFGTTTTPANNEEYNWTAPSENVYAQGLRHQNALISFPNTGTSEVYLTVNMAGIGCYHTDSIAVSVGSSSIEIPTVVYYQQNFICLLNNMDSYQWGYDDAVTLDSSIILGQTNQNYYNTTPNFTTKNYWVITTSGSCQQKTYCLNNVPNQITNVATNGDNVKVYPNPTSQDVNVEIATNGNNYSEVRIIDVTGKTLKTAMLDNNKATINVAELAQGIYLLGCYRDGLQVSVTRFIKN